MIDWAKLIAAAVQPASTEAVAFRERLPEGGWKPIVLADANGVEYAVKTLGMKHDTLSAGRTMFNEYAAASLGILLGVPIPSVALIDVPAKLIAREGLAPRLPGLAYGCRYFPGSSRCGQPESARIALFLQWTAWSPAEPQFIQTPSSLVYAIDFGNYLGGPDDVRQEPTPPTDPLDTSDPEAAASIAALRGITPEKIAAVMAAPPESWGIPLAERVQIAIWLYERQQQLLLLNSAT
jgi:hypothetical protein